MRVKWIVFLVLIILAMVFFILPTYAPTVTVKSVVQGARVTSGDTLLLLNQSDYALTLYDSALAENASDPMILKKKGEALIKCGRIQDAEQVYQQVLSQDGNDTAALVRKGDTLYQQGNLKGALSYYDQAIAVKPDDAHTWMRKGDALLMISIDEGQKLHEVAKGLSKQPGDSGYHPISAEQLESMDSYQKAVESYQKAMEIDPKLSVVVSTRILGATQNQVNSYQSLMKDVQS
jgi:tetratricopeptide (TPR) repeat protein